MFSFRSLDDKIKTTWYKSYLIIQKDDVGLIY